MEGFLPFATAVDGATDSESENPVKSISIGAGVATLEVDFFPPLPLLVPAAEVPDDLADVPAPGVPPLMFSPLATFRSMGGVVLCCWTLMGRDMSGLARRSASKSSRILSEQCGLRL